jgi:hypothetical protein
LMLSANPNLNPSEVLNMIVESSDKLDTFSLSERKNLNFGRINAHNSVQLAVYSIRSTNHNAQ